MDQFKALGTSIFAATVDSLEETSKVAEGLSFPVGWGVDKALGDQIGAFWEPRRDHIQPTEFWVNRKGRVFSSTYSTSPLGRMDPEETLNLITMISEAKKKG